MNSEKRVLVFGTFDCLHPGHEYLLREAAKRGSLFVIVARNKNVERIKGHAPIQSEVERLQGVQRVAPEADVRLGSTQDFLEPVRAIEPNLILLGYDQQLPPGVSDTDLPYPTERLAAFEPEKYKSSFL